MTNLIYQDNSITNEYKNSISKYKNFCVILTEQLNELINKNKIKLALPIEHRVKSLESIYEKLERNQLHIKSLSEINDLSGIRIITLFRSDIEKIRNSIEQEFTVHKYEDTSKRLQENQFGYESIHLEISMPNEWCKALNLRSFKNIKAEIQIRTLSQHNWAVMSHILQYKQEKDVPFPLKRSINRVAALLETVDNEFERLLQDRETYKQNIQIQSTDNSNPEEILNVENLQIILDNELPIDNKTMDESYSTVLKELNHFEILTKKELLDLIKKHIDAALIEDQKLVYNKELRDVSSNERILKGVFLSHVGLLREILRIHFGTKVVDEVINRNTKNE